MTGQGKRLSVRLDSVRAYFMAEYMRKHKIDKDSEFIKNAIDALKEKENNKTLKNIKEQEDKIFNILEAMAGIKQSRDKGPEEYLQELKMHIKEVNKISR